VGRLPCGARVGGSTSRRPRYQMATWPEETSSMQFHLDFDVDDLDATQARVLAAGAT